MDYNVEVDHPTSQRWCMYNKPFFATTSDGRASVFQEGRLKPSLFSILGFGRARVGQNLLRMSGHEGIYVLTGYRACLSPQLFWISGFGWAQVGQNVLRTSGRAGQARYPTHH